MSLPAASQMVAKKTQLGRYQLVSPLGSGAFADVYKAVDALLSRTVALKVLKPALLADEEAFGRFLQEAHIAADLIHPHIAVVWDLGQAEGSYFIAMRYVYGPSLDRLLGERGPLPWSEALKIAGDVAQALDYAHARGLVHRDVKPQNIIIGPTDGAVLTDFGLVRALETSGVGTRTGAILGTPQYIPPEVWKGKPATPAADQYALACIVVEMLTGKMLYDGPTPWAVMARHASPPELPARWPEDVPADVEFVLQTGLCQDPGGRFESCGEMIKVLMKKAPASSFPSIISNANLPNNQPLLKLPDSPNSISSVIDLESNDHSRTEQKSEINPIPLDNKLEDIIKVSDESDQANDPSHSRSLDGSGGWKVMHLFQVDCGDGDANIARQHHIALPDFRHGIFSVSSGKKISVIETRSGDIIQELFEQAPVMDIAFTKDSQTLVSVSANGSVSVYRSERPGKHWASDKNACWQIEYNVLRDNLFVNSVTADIAISPDDYYMAYSVDSKAMLLSLTTRKFLTSILASGSIHHLSYLANGDALLLVDDTGIRRWNLWNGRLSEPVQFPQNDLSVFAFSSNHQFCALCSKDDFRVVIMNTTTGKTVAELDTEGSEMFSLAFSPSGDIFAAGDDRNVYMWGNVDWQLCATLPGASSRIDDLQFTERSNELLSVCSGGTITVWQRAN